MELKQLKIGNNHNDNYYYEVKFNLLINLNHLLFFNYWLPILTLDVM